MAIRNYRFFSPSISMSGIQVLGAGHLLAKRRSWISKWRVRADYNLCLIRRGTALFQSREAGELRPAPGDCLLVFPGRPFLFQPESNRVWEEYFIHFQGPVVQAMENEGAFSPAKPLFRLRHPDKILLTFKAAMAAASSNNLPRKQRLPGLLFQAINEVLLNQRSLLEAQPRNEEPARKIIRKMLEHPEKEWNFRELAKAHDMSYSYFLKRVKRIFGFPLHRLLNLERMKFASKMLASGMTVTETCFRTGMDDPYHFSRLFKKLMGKPPSAFREIASKIVVLPE
ncbi:MAG: AraC family transcriptional regulator [Fibrobacterota bacterium]